MRNRKLQTVQQVANAIARQWGSPWATDYVITASTKCGYRDYVRHGYRKNTTGEYVSTSYRAHFGWKNTYYQALAITAVISADYAAQRLWGVNEAGTLACLA